MDTYNEKAIEFHRKLKKFQELTKDFIENALIEAGFDSEAIIVMPLPIKEKCDCMNNALKDLANCVLYDRSYFMVSGSYQWSQQLLNLFTEKLIETDNFEGINSIKQLKESLKSNETHFLGMIPEEAFFQKQD